MPDVDQAAGATFEELLDHLSDLEQLAHHERFERFAQLLAEAITRAVINPDVYGQRDAARPLAIVRIP